MRPHAVRRQQCVQNEPLFDFLRSAEIESAVTRKRPCNPGGTAGARKRPAGQVADTSSSNGPLCADADSGAGFAGDFRPLDEVDEDYDEDE